MAAQQGFQYEHNTATYLKKLRLVDKNFHPAGSGSDRPDLEITHDGQTCGVELKITAASAGSLVLKYSPTARQGDRWGFNDIAGDPEKKFLANLADESGALKEINKKWKNIPLKQDNPDPLFKVKVAKIAPQKRYEIELMNFKELNGDVDARYIDKYYIQKKTYYVNVGTHGFYTFGPKDPFGLNTKLKQVNLPQVPQFGKAANSRWRARVQYKGSGNYQFTFELSFSIPSSEKSPYNIAPIKKGTVMIDPDEVNISCFL